jgi:ABC-2 type transport system permease protein
MTYFLSALWGEVLKARRSMITLLTALGVMLLPLAGGLFMVILKDPEAARNAGLISTKAHIVAGSADWPAYFAILLQGTAAAGALIFALITSWIFGSEFSNRTNTRLLALPASRSSIVLAKFALLAGWTLALGVLIFLGGLTVGSIVKIPGWSPGLAGTCLRSLLGIVILTYMLMPLVALLASAGRGYLPPIGWAFFTLALAQIAAFLGWGDRVPWSVPAVLSGAAGPASSAVGLHSYVMVAAAFALGLGATLLWWLQADQAR